LRAVVHKAEYKSPLMVKALSGSLPLTPD